MKSETNNLWRTVSFFRDSWEAIELFLQERHPRLCYKLEDSNVEAIVRVHCTHSAQPLFRAMATAANAGHDAGFRSGLQRGMDNK